MGEEHASLHSEQTGYKNIPPRQAVAGGVDLHGPGWFSVSDLLARRRAVLVWVGRASGCAPCREYLATLSDSASTLESRGVAVVVLGADPPELLALLVKPPALVASDLPGLRAAVAFHATVPPSAGGADKRVTATRLVPLTCLAVRVGEGQGRGAWVEAGSHWRSLGPGGLADAVLRRLERYRG
ncbi:MAG: hypothetical protein Kow0069_16330 [Promethearchaeota archaeon]